MPFTRTDRYILAGLLLLNGVLKLLWLGVNELAHDEPFTVYWAQRPLGELWALMRTENNPPLHFLMTKAWNGLVPAEPAWWRVPSAIFSTLVVWPLYLLGRKLGGRTVAVTGALLFTLCNYHYGFAHEVRAYALFTLLATASMWSLVRTAELKRTASWHTAAWAVVNVLLVYTHFFGWLVVGLQVLCIVLLPELRPIRKQAAIALGAAVLAYVPYALVFAGRVNESLGKGTWLTPPVPEELYNMVWRWSNAPVLAVAFLSVVALAVGVNRLKNLGLRLTLLWTVLPLVGMFLVSFVVPMFLDRYLVYAAPGFALLVAVSIASLKIPKPFTIGASALAVAGMGITFTPWKDNGRHPSRVVAQVEAWHGSEQVVLLHPHFYDLTYAYHQDPVLFLSSSNIPKSLAEGGIHAAAAFEELPQAGSVAQVVLVQSGGDRPEVWQTLRTAFPENDSVEADHAVWVYRFRR